MNTNMTVKPLTKGLLSAGKIGQILLLILWVLFQHERGNDLYAATVVLISLALFTFRLKTLALIATPVLVIVLFKTSIVDTAVQIRASNLISFQSFKPSMSNLFTPESGRNILAQDVQQMISLLEENEITEYQLSSLFNAETKILITEAAWPIRQNDTSPYLLYGIEEHGNLAGCTTLDERKVVALAYCP
jgi:hypothetical protein